MSGSKDNLLTYLLASIWFIALLIMLVGIYYSLQEEKNTTYIWNNITCQEGTWAHCGYTLKECSDGKKYACATGIIVNKTKNGEKNE